MTNVHQAQKMSHLESKGKSRCGDFGGMGLNKLSLNAMSLRVGLGSFALLLGTMKGLYLGFSLTGGGGPLLWLARNKRGDLGTILGKFFSALGGMTGTSESSGEALSFLSVCGEVVNELCSLRLRSEVSFLFDDTTLS